MSQAAEKKSYADEKMDAKMKMSAIVPGSKKTKTISIYNPFTEKMTRVGPSWHLAFMKPVLPCAAPGLADVPAKPAADNKCAAPKRWPPSE